MIQEQAMVSPPLDPASKVLLDMQHVSVCYEGSRRDTLTDISFQLMEGESVLFLGPSGCGKSTLAMLCANLIPSAIEATVSGTVQRHPQIAEPGRIGYVFQDAEAQFCMLNVADEIAFGLENQQLPPSEMAAKVLRSLDDVGLSHQAMAEHAEFSGGMKQKLAIASALAMEPELLIFDEPTANLDPFSSRQVYHQINRLHKTRKSMIVIEHKFDTLLYAMDRVVLFDATGHIHRTGPTLSVLQDEWEWLIDAGVVPTWKQPPSVLQPSLGVGQFEIKKISGAADSLPSGSTSAKHPAVVLEAARLDYGKQTVWDNVQLKLPEGAFVAIVGPNGAGKSSLLQAVAGLQKLTSGRVLLNGRPLSKISGKERVRAISFCFQNPEHQFIYERVADELANQRVDSVPQDVAELLHDFGLSGHEQQSPFALSQGQKRRLSVAAMLRQSHDFYLLDEPTFGQDARTQAVIMRRIDELHRAGKTIIMTTHDMDLVSQFATHVVVLAEGGLQFVGAPSDLLVQTDLLARAHLLDDVNQIEEEVSVNHAGPPRQPDILATVEPAALKLTGLPGLGKWLNPPVHLVTTLLAVVVGVFAHSIVAAVLLFAIPLLIMLSIGRLNPWQIVRRLAPFVFFYVMYIWTMTAFAQVPPGTKTIDFLWMHLSYPGFLQGLILAFRMLSAVSFGVLFVSVTHITELVVGLSQNFKVPPKFSYGTLAGIRFAPLFQSEWNKLKRARQLRGKDAGWAIVRPVTYALPLLNQAIRMSERVAVAMESRGFFGAVAEQAQARTYFRTLTVRAWDLLYGIVVVGLALAVVLFT